MEFFSNVEPHGNVHAVNSCFKPFNKAAVVGVDNALLFVEISRRRIQAIVERVSAPDVTAEEIQEAGEDLVTLLDRVLEVKMSGGRLLDILEELR